MNFLLFLIDMINKKVFHRTGKHTKNMSWLNCSDYLIKKISLWMYKSKIIKENII